MTANRPLLVDCCLTAVYFMMTSWWPLALTRRASAPVVGHRAVGRISPLRPVNQTRSALQWQDPIALRRATNVHWQSHKIDKTARAALKGQKPCILWFTGLSGAGKSTIADLLEQSLHRLGRHTILLDGDNIRHGLNRDLGFTDEDRVENIRRIAEVAKLMVEAGLVVLVSFISPFRSERRMARQMVGPDEFIEIYVDTPIEICEARDPKGLYRLARTGKLPNLTGIGSPYEVPENAEIVLNAAEQGPADLVEPLMKYLKERGVV
jgi:bifunctional enzyme CysN/CysC